MTKILNIAFKNKDFFKRFFSTAKFDKNLKKWTLPDTEINTKKLEMFYQLLANIEEAARANKDKYVFNDVLLDEQDTETYIRYAVYNAASEHKKYSTEGFMKNKHSDTLAELMFLSNLKIEIYQNEVSGRLEVKI